MTLIAAARIGGKTWIAADTACGDSTGLVRKDDSKLWRVNRDLCIGLAGNAGQLSHLQYGTPWGPLDPPSRPGRAWVYKAIAAPVRSHMLEHSKRGDLDFECIVVARGRIFVFDSDASILSSKTFAAVGTGAVFAHGYWAGADPRRWAKPSVRWHLRTLVKKAAEEIESVGAPAIVWDCSKS